MNKENKGNREPSKAFHRKQAMGLGYAEFKPTA